MAAEAASRLWGTAWEKVSFAEALRAEAAELYRVCENGHVVPAFGYRVGVHHTLRFDRPHPRPWVDGAGWAEIVYDGASLPCRCGSTSFEALDPYQRTDEIRLVLQTHGTDVRRVEDPDYWVRKALEKADEVLASGRAAVITDVRFPNEAMAIKAGGGLVVRLEVSQETAARRLARRDGRPIAWTAHDTETALDSARGLFDLTVSNEGPLEETVSKVVEFVSRRG